MRGAWCAKRSFPRVSRAPRTADRAPQFDHRDIDLDVPELADSRLVRTGENRARYIFECVQRALGGGAAGTAVRVAENDALRVTYDGRG